MQPNCVTETVNKLLPDGFSVNNFTCSPALRAIINVGGCHQELLDPSTRWQKKPKWVIETLDKPPHSDIHWKLPPTPLQSHIASAKWVTLAGRKRTVKERKYHTIYMCLSLSRMVLNTGIQRTNVLNKWAQWNLKPKEIYQSNTDWNLSKQTRYLSCFHLSPSLNIEKTHPCYTLGTDKRYVQPFNADLMLICARGIIFIFRTSVFAISRKAPSLLQLICLLINICPQCRLLSHWLPPFHVSCVTTQNFSPLALISISGTRRNSEEVECEMNRHWVQLHRHQNWW